MNSGLSGKKNKPESPQMGSILSGILSKYMERCVENMAPSDRNETVCPTCGMTFSSFMKERLLGCPDCYSTFSMVVEKQLKAVQPGTYHVGKVPSNPEVFEKDNADALKGKGKKRAKGKNADSKSKTQKKSRLLRDESADLKEQLKNAVEAEDFMLAARIRDKIKEMENEKKDNKVVHGKKRS